MVFANVGVFCDDRWIMAIFAKKICALAAWMAECWATMKNRKICDYQWQLVMVIAHFIVQSLLHISNRKIFWNFEKASIEVSLIKKVKRRVLFRKGDQHDLEDQDLEEKDLEDAR